MTDAAEPLLDAEHAAFVLGGVSVVAASGNAACVPSLARATGCRVSDDRRRVTLFVATSYAQALLQHIRETGAIAVVFTEPCSHRTVQLKGRDARIEALQEGDLERVGAYRQRWIRALTDLGFAEDLPRTMLACPSQELVAVAFTVTAAFSQTPGPRAGSVLGAQV